MIYAIRALQDDSLVKIGLVHGNDPDDVASRVRALSVGNPFDLVCVSLTDGGLKDERRLHRRFEHYRYRGEWFLNFGDVSRWVTRFRIKEPIDGSRRLPGQLTLLARPVRQQYNGAGLPRLCEPISEVVRDISSETNHPMSVRVSSNRTRSSALQSPDPVPVNDNQVRCTLCGLLHVNESPCEWKWRGKLRRG